MGKFCYFPFFLSLLGALWQRYKPRSGEQKSGIFFRSDEQSVRLQTSQTPSSLGWVPPSLVAEDFTSVTHMVSAVYAVVTRGIPHFHAPIPPPTSHVKRPRKTAPVNDREHTVSHVQCTDYRLTIEWIDIQFRSLNETLLNDHLKGNFQ